MKKYALIITYALSIFVGAFLLFQIQPLIGKYILPWFGGGPEVWTTCMLFFQTLLLGGYVYAHLSIRFLRPRIQAGVHVVLLAGAVASLFVVSAAVQTPGEGSNPTLQILLLLTASIGLPYFVLSATSPLMQSWFSSIRSGVLPYRFFALSNAGALLALLSYPFVVEPLLSRQQQWVVWSAGLGVFALVSALCAFNLWKFARADNKPSADPQPEAEHSGPIAISSRLLWFALPAGASVVLLAVTNKICQDLAAIPFLWILPLSLYLLSFIICFDNAKWYFRRLFVAVFILTLIAVIYLRANEANVEIWIQVVLNLAALFAACMVCHGELYRLKPPPRHLTSYYLAIAAGGAIGGFFVAVIAPLVFDTYLELYLGLLGCALFALLADPNPAIRRRRWLWAALIVLVGVAAVAVEGNPAEDGDRIVKRSRNFYGVLTLMEKDYDDPNRRRYVLQHGTTFHGLQFIAPSRRSEPTAYYGPDAGGLTMLLLPRKTNLRIGVVGLGVGTLATYGKTGDLFRFYEINPEVTRLAETVFTYLSDTPAKVEIIMGDARVSMQREQPQMFDVLFLDAFSSDAIPVHLLTAEAFETYLRHLKDDGILAVHVSTQYLDIQSVIFKLAEHFDLRTAWIISDENEWEGVLSSNWILLTNNEQFLKTPQIQHSIGRVPPNFRRIRLWTDDYVSLMEVLK